MVSSSEKETKVAEKISLTVAKWQPSQVEQVSPIKVIGGYPWRLRLLLRYDYMYELFLRCEMSTEAELWECRANIKNRSDVRAHPYDSASWKPNQEQRVGVYKNIATGRLLEVEITPDDDGERWRRRPILDPFVQRDGVLLIGEEGNKINVNKPSLASQSPFFDRLFFGNFKEKNMAEIPIGDVEYEEFFNMIKLVYGFDGASVTDVNVRRVLELADKFELKIVEDRAVNYLLSSSPSFTIHEKLLIAELSNISFFKEKVISQYTDKELKRFSDSPEWELLSRDTLKLMYKKRFRLYSTSSSDSDSSSD